MVIFHSYVSLPEGTFVFFFALWFRAYHTDRDYTYIVAYCCKAHVLPKLLITFKSHKEIQRTGR